MQKAKVGIIGGSALYSINGSRVLEEVDMETPWGRPSDSISIVDIDGHVAAIGSPGQFADLFNQEYVTNGQSKNTVYTFNSYLTAVPYK